MRQNPGRNLHGSHFVSQNDTLKEVVNPTSTLCIAVSAAKRDQGRRIYRTLSKDVTFPI